MSEKSPHVSFMKDYLKHALEFEKYVYIWSNSMNKANKQMRSIYSRRSELEGIRDSAHHALESLNSGCVNKRNEPDKEIAPYKNKARITFGILIIDIIVIIIGSFAAIIEIQNHSEAPFEIPKIIALTIGCAIPVFVSTIIGPICLGIYVFNRKKYKQLIKKNSLIYSEDSRRRQEILLTEKERQAENNWVITVAEESVLSEKQKEISIALQSAKKRLSEIYSKNILPTKYRSLNAVATLYEYLETGRCNTIQGHGGIYDTYETDLQRGLIIKTLTDIRDSMHRIEANQQLLYRELQQVNQTLSSINSSLTEIKTTNSEIAKNTAISAVANQQTAASTRWMAWNAWANGY